MEEVGYGRGGRGLAILEKIKQRQQQQQKQQKSLEESVQHRQQTIQLAASLHHALLDGVTSKQPEQIPAVQHGHAHHNGDRLSVGDDGVQSAELPQMPAFVGRGNIANVMASLKQTQQVGIARGRQRPALTASQAEEKDAFGKCVSAQFPGEGQGLSTAAAKMSQLTLSPSTTVCQEIVRKPIVSRRGAPGQCGGELVDLTVNYVTLYAKHKLIHQFHVSFDPAIESLSMKIGLLNEHKGLLKVKLFDGSIMYLPEPLPDKETKLLSTRKTDKKEVAILIRKVKMVPIEEMPQLYNILIRRIMLQLNLCQVGRYFYNPNAAEILPQHSLELWPGYITSIRHHEGGLKLLLDVSHRVLRTETVQDFFESISNTRRPNFQREVAKHIVGCIVITRYNNRTYRVDDIDWKKTPEDTFEMSSGQKITFAEYYWVQYQRRVNRTQPLLIHQPKPRKDSKSTPDMIYLIPELCHRTGLTADITNNYAIMKDLNFHTRCNPSKRLAKMKRFVDAVKSCPEAYQQLENWGLSLDDSALSVQGRQMRMESITFGKGGHQSAGPTADWSRAVMANNVIKAIDMEKWAVFYVRPNHNDVQNFVDEMQRVSLQLGIHYSRPELIQLRDDKVETLLNNLRRSVNPATQMIVVVMPTCREDKYAAVKKFACIECPVPSQVILHKTIRVNPSQRSKLHSVAQKIALQMNCKLGGELWAVRNPLDGCMVVGLDAYHSEGRKSIGAFVASTNAELTRWYSKTCIQTSGDDLLPGLQLFMLCAVKKYYELNHSWPSKIIVYRDGVGDGQIDVVQDFEVRQIVESFSKVDQQYHPKLAVVIVQKRISTRIFSHSRGHFDNPPPGTVLDHTITRPYQYDYFIVSQHVRQGTVTPTHYIVVHDSLSLPPDRMQVFTYKMTHMYYNWPGTVRVPAPCLYAHKLAYLVGESIHKSPSECLSDRLFFL